MEEEVFTKKKFILQVILLIILCGLFFGSFQLIDRAQERKLKLQLAELNRSEIKEDSNERR